MPRRSLKDTVRDGNHHFLTHQSLVPAFGSNDFTGKTEAVYFDYFRNCTLPSTNACFDSSFWSQTVLQLCHREPAIKHGVLALSSMHQQWRLDASGSEVAKKAAFRQYNEAINHANKLLSRTQSQPNWDKAALETILVACILFVCFENLAGNYRNSAMHLHSGLEIISKHIEPPRILDMETVAPQRTSSQDDISELFERLTLQAMSFGESWLPMEYAGRSGFKTFKETVPPPMPEKFNSITDARRHLFSQVHWAFMLGQAMEMCKAGVTVYPAQEPQQTILEARAGTIQSIKNLDLWSRRFDDFLTTESCTGNTTSQSTVASTYLKIYHLMTAILSIGDIIKDETGWDSYIDSFSRLVDLATSLLKQIENEIFSLELGICIPLFFVAQKCRQPRIRRRAIALLAAVDRKEGLWESVAAGKVAERIMEIEEDGARKLLGADHVIREPEDIPDAVRVFSIYSKAHLKEKKVRVGFVTRPHGNGWEMVRNDEWVCF